MNGYSYSGSKSDGFKIKYLSLKNRIFQKNNAKGN
jgi:hypothetical protein